MDNLAKQVITGKVVIAKSPCVHPGDVRVFTAVDDPALHHLVDCVAFPSKGNRPHPNELSGSDLDGDMYLVIWDPELVPLAANKPAGDYSPPQSSSTNPLQAELKPFFAALANDKSEDARMIEFFIKYISTNSIGRIANTWVKDIRCICTGKPVALPRDLLVKEYPHFMDKPRDKSYTSKSILGKLYDQVCTAVDEQSTGIQKPRYHHPNVNFNVQEEEAGYSVAQVREIALAFDAMPKQTEYETYLTAAGISRDKYNASLEAILHQFGCTTEAEAITGNVQHLFFPLFKNPLIFAYISVGKLVNLSLWQLNQRHNESLYSTVESMRASLNELWRITREEFQREFAAERYACPQADAEAPAPPPSTATALSSGQRQERKTTLLTTEQRQLRSTHRKAKAYAW